MSLVTCNLSLRVASAATIIRDTEIESVVYELVAPLARAAGMPDGRLKVHIIGDSDFNAFVAGGEDVFVNTGLITQIKNPDAFQAVIAHELGHMAGGHMAHLATRMKAEMYRMLAVQMLGVALMVANPMAGMGVLAGSGGIAQGSLLAFTRDEERVADAMSIDIMVKAGIDPAGFIDAMKYMQQIAEPAENRTNPLNKNHPMTAERLRNAKDKIDTVKNREKLKRSSPAQIEKYEMIRAKIIGYMDKPNIVAGTFPTSDKSLAADYARAISAMRANDLIRAKQIVGPMIVRDPDNPFFYELLGDLHFQSGEMSMSVDAYQEALDLLKNNAPQIQVAMALALTGRKKPGDAEKAVNMAKRAILSDQLPLAYWVLSIAYSQLGKEGEADWAMAEYHVMVRNMDRAKELAKSAQRKLAPGTPEYIKSGDILRN
jgi:predicted Zn-dependent protease